MNKRRWKNSWKCHKRNQKKGKKIIFHESSFKLKRQDLESFTRLGHIGGAGRRASWKIHSRAIARSRGLIAGDPGGVSACRFASSTLPVCMTVILCLKSSGKEIWPGAFFKSCWRTESSKFGLYFLAQTCLQLRRSDLSPSLHRRRRVVHDDLQLSTQQVQLAVLQLLREFHQVFLLALLLLLHPTDFFFFAA